MAPQKPRQQDQQPVRQNRVRFSEIGNTGLNRQGGIVHEEYLPQLYGEKGVKVFKEMSSNDPVVGAILFTIDMLLRGVEWTIEAAEEGGEAEDDKTFLEECMDDMEDTWEDFISEVLSMLVYGWSFHEIVYRRRLEDEGSKHDDGKIGWRYFPIRAQETLFEWIWNEQTGDLIGFSQQPPPDYNKRVIPMEKGLLFRTSAHKDNPEGKSILRNAYRAWYFKKKIEEIEGVGIERDLAGLPCAWVPPELLRDDADPDQKSILAEIKNIVKNVRRDEQEGMIFPLLYDDKGNKVFDFMLMSTGGTRQFDTDRIIARYEQRIAMSALADFILLGHENVGSFALSSDKTDLFAVALGAWLDAIAAVINRQAVPKLFKLNGMERDKYPTLKHEDIESPELTEIADYVSKMSAIGMPLLPDERLENHLRKIAGLPERDENMAAVDEALEQIPGLEGVGAGSTAEARTGVLSRQEEADSALPPQSMAEQASSSGIGNGSTP